MESAPKSAPWHQSMPVLIIATLLLPPWPGHAWMRKDSGIGKKIFASFAILALVASFCSSRIAADFRRRDPIWKGTTTSLSGSEPSSEQQQHQLPPP